MSQKSIAMGINSSVQNNAIAGLAIGSGTSTTVAGGVALGSDSRGNVESGKAGYDFVTGKATTQKTPTWVANRGAVAVGNGSNTTRQITSVAAGTNDTDAVNVAQVKLLAKQLNTDGTTYFHTNATGAAVEPVNNNRGIASSTAGAGGKNSLAAGINAKVAKDAEEGIVIGFNSNVAGKQAVMLGSRGTANGEGSVSMGFNSMTNGNYGVGIGYQARSSSEGGVSIGKEANSSTKGVSIGMKSVTNGQGSVAVGSDARVLNDGMIGFSGVAIGKNAYVLNGMGKQEYQFSFDKDNWKSVGGFLNKKHEPKDQEAADRMPAGIAIGANAYSRTGSIDIGARTMKGKVMGGIDIIDQYANIMDMTTVGTNAYNKGFMSTIVGAYSINTGDFDNSGTYNNLTYGSQNMGSTIVGSLNQNLSKGYEGTSGVANNIVGVANIVENANGALIYGAGNKITNSIKPIYGFDANSGVATVDEMVNKLADSVRRTEGGATLAIGGGNIADYTQDSQIIGINNTLKGEDGNISNYNLVNGYKNTANNVHHVSLIGSHSEVKDTNTMLLFGDNRVASQTNNSIILGSSDDKMTTDKENIVIIGQNANATVVGGVALGAGSVASVSSGVVGYDPITKAASTDESSTWKATDAAVAIGDGTAHTRQITGVAAGSNDTDAVNVAQLKKVVEEATANTDTNSHVKVGDYTVGNVVDSSGQNTQGVSLEVVNKDNTSIGNVVIGNIAKASDVGNLNYVSGGKGTKGNIVTNGDTITVAIGKLDVAIDKATSAVGKNTVVSSGDNISVTNIANPGEAANYKVSLKDDINVNSINSKKATIGGIVINNDDKAVITGLSNKTWNQNNIVTGQAATEDQLKEATKNFVSYDNDSHTSLTLNNGGDSTIIKNVANGNIAKDSKDAVNGGQLYETNQLINQYTGNISNAINNLDGKIEKVGAGAAALAALHPQDFDPNDKWDFAVGYGNYRNGNSLAIGAFYRPNDRTMFSVGGSLGSGENMINLGITFKVGEEGEYTSYSRYQLTNIIVDQNSTIIKLEERIKQQDAENAVLKEELEQQKAQIQQIMEKLNIK